MKKYILFMVVWLVGLGINVGLGYGVYKQNPYAMNLATVYYAFFGSLMFLFGLLNVAFWYMTNEKKLYTDDTDIWAYMKRTGKFHFYIGLPVWFAVSIWLVMNGFFVSGVLSTGFFIRIILSNISWGLIRVGVKSGDIKFVSFDEYKKEKENEKYRELITEGIADALGRKK